MDQRRILIVDLDGPVLDVSERYYRSHLLALRSVGATSPVTSSAELWRAKREGMPFEALVDDTSMADAYASAFLAHIERHDLMRFDRLQRGALAALEVLLLRFDVRILSLRTNAEGATETVRRLGISALVPVTFIPHNPGGKV